MSCLYIVATPIGNLGDITFRAVDTLRSVGLVAAEDTRHTLALLTHFGIRVTMVSVRSQNEQRAAEKVLAALREGKDVAYVSDAGTPALSDPGAVLAGIVAEAGFPVVPIPGPSAFAALLSVAGGRDKSVLFEGFLSPKDGRRKARLKELLERGEAFVVYESPFRILKLLANLADLDSERQLCLGREMTKIHEEFLRGNAAEVAAALASGAGDGAVKGEIALYVGGNVAKACGRKK
jgi:16S rRNA (cytidine1402-2'-O)-methyltransferase